jgi:hypothetical protein
MLDYDGSDIDEADDYYNDEDEEVDMNVLGPDGPRLCSDKCPTCIFRPGNVPGLRPGRLRQMVRDSLAGGGFIPCHETIHRTDGVRPAICRGFFDAHGPRSNVIRIWGRLGGFCKVDPPGIGRPTAADEGS